MEREIELAKWQSELRSYGKTLTALALLLSNSCIDGAILLQYATDEDRVHVGYVNSRTGRGT